MGYEKISQIDFLKVVHELVESVGDPLKLIDKIINTAVNVVGAKGGSLLLVSPPSGRLFFYSATGESKKNLQGIELKKGSGIAGWVFENKKSLVVQDVQKDTRWNREIGEKIDVDIKSIVAVPLKIKDKVIGVLELIESEEGKQFDDNDLHMIEAFADIAAATIDKSQILDNYTKENKQLRTELEQKYQIIGSSENLKRVLADAERVAESKSTTIICGDSGTGKELVARLIHNKSLRKTKPFIAINCGVFPESLLERELFGHEKGSFTGADSNKIGLFEVAHGGTLFLDEIGETTPLMQVKLLRVIQEGTFFRIGGTSPIPFDVRIIAATNRDLEAMVRDGAFREDLYYRLNVVRINLPTLKDRVEDIPLLINYFVSQKCPEMGKPMKSVSAGAMKIMLNYPWPGNIRELENCIERAIVMGSSQEILAEDLPYHITNPHVSSDIKEGLTLKEGINRFKKEFVLKTLEYAGGNKNKAASLLGIQRTYLYRLFNELGINN